MEAGEKEMRKIFEELTTRNVRTCVDYSTATRELVRVLETRVQLLENKLTEQTNINNQLIQRLSLMQGKLYEACR